MTERFAHGQRRPVAFHERPVGLPERAQILRRSRYALTCGLWSEHDRALLALAANGAGRMDYDAAIISVNVPLDNWWDHLRDSNQQGLRQLALTLDVIGVPAKLPRNAAAPRRRRPRA
jgi:hypothetical protein